MVLSVNKCIGILVFAGASFVTSSSQAEPVSACGKTNIGRPLSGFTMPKNIKHSNDLINDLGAPFHVATVEDQGKDILIYVDGYFEGKKTVVKSSDPALGDLQSSSRRTCGVALVFTFVHGVFSSWEATALTTDDLTKAHASQFGDTTWAAVSH